MTGATDRIERPRFHDGQILGAADLGAGVDYERDQLARHERHLHLWGIATGLELTAVPRKDSSGRNYIDVVVAAGVAVDGTGREIVVPVDSEASAAEFEDRSIAISNAPDAWYPVFLVGHDREATTPPLLPNACNGSASTRMAEDFSILFGRPGDAADLDQQLPAAVPDGPRGTIEDGWRILLGFVKWDSQAGKFSAVTDHDAGIGRRYAGVQADTVAARAGTLTLQTRTKSTPSKPGVVLSEEKGGMLKFGPLDQRGDVSAPVFAVDAAGNITGSLATGAVLVESGIATDGVILPLPSGVTAPQVASGKAKVHTQVSIRVDASSRPPGAIVWAATPLEAYVDTDRRLHCRIRWVDVVNTVVEDRPATCDYVVVVATAK